MQLLTVPVLAVRFRVKVLVPSISFHPAVQELEDRLEPAGWFFLDITCSLVMCRFNNRGPAIGMDYMADILETVTGWDFSGEEASKLGYRIVNLLRTFNIRHGIDH